ncbi:MAG TPA: serine/threonine-protein kinase [Nannocystaceae bacterium]|nr:serine/threonine-protein kinase [Nannocystaceae bacterium]
MEEDERTRASRADSIDSGAIDATNADGIGDDELPVERLLPGAALGRYAVLGQLGAGAMGVVYAAYDGQLARKVAIKVVKLDRRDVGSSGTGVPRLLREAQALARLSHPNVVPIFDVGSEGDRMFLAMELIEGETLREWLDHRPRRWREIVEVMIGAARGLAAAHAAQIVHRDFKPDNVLVGGLGIARVSDFGLARGLQEEVELISNPIDSHDSLSRTLTRTGSVMGTPGYMAPEQHFGRPAEPRSDQYAFCVSLYEALYGMRPFTAGAIEAVARQKWTNTITDPGSARPRGMPEELHRIIVRGLDRDPEARFAKMEDLIVALERVLHRPSRVPWIAGAAVVAVVAGAWAVSMRPRACDDARAQLGDVWNDTRASAVEAAFASAPTRASATMWPRVQQGLDDYATHWAEVHEGLCRAGDDATTRLDAGMACLRARKGELAAVIDALAAADRGTVHAAFELVDSLDDPSACTDPATIAAPDDDPMRAARRIMVGDEVAATSARVEAAQYPQAIELGEVALEHARALADATLECTVEIQLGIAKARSGRYDEAERHYTATFWHAREHGLDDLALEAATRMVFLLGAEVEDAPRSRDWLRHAEAQLARTGAYQTRAHASLLQNAAQVHELLGDLPRAEQDLRDALEVRKLTDAEDSRSVSTLRNNLGTMLAGRGRLEEALAMHTLARANRVSRLGPVHPDVAMSDINIAHVLTRLARYHEAIDHLYQADALVAETMGQLSPMMATLRSIRGVLWLNLGRNDLAALEFQAVLAFRVLRLGPSHPSVGSAWNLVGAGFDRPEDGELGNVFFRRALTIFESAGEVGAIEAAQTRMNIGSVLMRVGKIAEAEPLVRDAFAELERSKGPDDPIMSQSLLARARLEVELGHYEAALADLDRARAIDRAIGMGAIERAANKFHRARARWQLDRDRPAAHALAREARALAAADADVPTGELKMIDAWLATHPEPAR